MPNIDRIKQLVNRDEGETLDFKLELHTNDRAKGELAKDVTAFANTKGGTILVGVRENPREVVGISEPLHEEQLIQIISDRTDPPVNVEVTSHTIENARYLGEIHVGVGKFVHRVMPEKIVYVRRRKIIDRASPAEIYRLKAEREEISRTILDKKPDIPAVEDNTIFMLSGESFPYGTTSKIGRFHALADCPVFLPDFSMYTRPPEFGRLGSPLHIRYEHPRDLPHRDFIKKTKRVEDLLLSLSTYVDTRDRFYWSISSEGTLTYGCSTETLLKALDVGKMGVVTLATCGEYSGGYASPFMLLISGYCKYRSGKDTLVRDPAVDLYLSSVPISSDWIQTLFQPFIVEESRPFHALSYEPGYAKLSIWKPIARREERAKKPVIRGVVRRIKYSADDEYSPIGGVILDTKWFSPNYYSYEQPWSGRDGEVTHLPTLDEAKCPAELFSEVVAVLTNPLVLFEEIISGEVRSSWLPVIRQFTVDGYGHAIHILGINGGPVMEG